MEAIKFIDLFAGMGGIRIPFDELGYKCVFSSEWDEKACDTYFANFGDYPSGDITQIDEKDIPSFDICLWLVMQTAKADTVPTDIRSNCSFRCVLGPGKDTMYQTVFGSGSDIPDNRIIPKGGGYYICDGKTMHPMSFICPTVDFDVAKSLKDAGIHFIDGNNDAAGGSEAAVGGTV